jgi:hypothetical protein
VAEYFASRDLLRAFYHRQLPDAAFLRQGEAVVSLFFYLEEGGRQITDHIYVIISCHLYNRNNPKIFAYVSLDGVYVCTYRSRKKN